MNEQTFEQIWNGPRYNKLRVAFATANPVPCSYKCDPSNGCKSDQYAPLVKLAKPSETNHSWDSLELQSLMGRNPG